MVRVKKHTNVLGYLALWVGVLAAFGYGEWERQNRERDVVRAIQINCNIGNEHRSTLRTILMDANRRTQSSKQRTTEEKKEAAEFYEKALNKLKPFNCGKLIKP